MTSFIRLALVTLLALALVASTHAMHLEDGWTEPEFVDFLEVEQLPLQPVRVPVPTPRPTNAVAVDATRVAPVNKPVTPAPSAPLTPSAPVPYIAYNLNFNDPTAGDLLDSEVTYDSVLDEVKPQFYEDVQIRKAELQVKTEQTPLIPYQAVPVDTTVTYGFPRVGAAPSAPKPDLLASTGPQRTVVSSSASGLCGAYAGSAVMKITGNEGVVYDVVKILPQHSQNPKSLSLAPSASDNTIRTVTACAFSKMYDAAKKAGVTLLIGSGFRTLGRQQYFWNCHISKKCNKGRLAAKPGRSNHGRGLALDLNQAAPGVYRWLAAHAHEYGFIRTVRTERWHWEYRPGSPKAPYTGTK